MTCSVRWTVILTACIYSASPLLDEDFDGFDKEDITLAGPRRSECQRIAVSACKQMPWNLTSIPNMFHHNSQSEASKALQHTELGVLFRSNCSPSITHLICSLLTPFCENGNTIKPCQHFCSAVLSSCCSSGRCPIDCSILTDEEPCFRYERGNIYSVRGVEVVCSHVGPDGYSLQLADGQDLNGCGIPCSVASTDKWFSGNPASIRTLLFVVAVICLILCLFTVLTFLIDCDRFRYPERSIVYICVCFISISACYVASTAHSWRHAEADLITCEGSLLIQGVRQWSCIVLFLFTYIPWLCASAWFVILSFTWFLAAVLKWSHEAIGHYALYFHLTAWLSPMPMVLVSFSLQAIATDPVSGLCMPVRNGRAIRALLTAPHILYLVVGSFFLLIGFVSLFKTRNVMRYEGTQTKKLEKLMLRIGFFALLYLMPSLAVCVGNYHEQVKQSRWITWLVCQQQEVNLHSRCASELLSLAERPRLEILALKQFMFLAVGVVVSFWVWCPKTMIIWKKFLFSCAELRAGKDLEASV